MASNDIDRAVQQESGEVGGRLRCARALAIARRLGVSPGLVGDAANRLGIRIADCQLGCFGVHKLAPQDVDRVQVPPALADELAASLVDGSLHCPTAFEIAARLKVQPRKVGHAATRQGIRISGCQLGCFP